MEAQLHLLQGLPNEIPELILCLLNTEHLLQRRLFTSSRIVLGFAFHSQVKTLTSKHIMNNRIKEVIHGRRSHVQQLTAF